MLAYNYPYTTGIIQPV